VVAQRASVGARQPSTGTDKRTQLLSVHATGLESTESVMCRLVPLDNHDRMSTKGHQPVTNARAPVTAVGPVMR
jgi:hypothetical protein